MHVHTQAATGGFFAQQAHGQRTVGHRAFKVGNAANHINAEIQRLFQQIKCTVLARRVITRGLVAQHTVLRKSHQLQVKIRRNAALDFQQGLDREQARIAGVRHASGSPAGLLPLPSRNSAWLCQSAHPGSDAA